MQPLKFTPSVPKESKYKMFALRAVTRYRANYERSTTTTVVVILPLKFTCIIKTFRKVTEAELRVYWSSRIPAPRMCRVLYEDRGIYRYV